MNAPSRLDRELNELLQELRVIQGNSAPGRLPAYIVVTVILWWILPRHSVRQASREHDEVVEH